MKGGVPQPETCTGGGGGVLDVNNTLFWLTPIIHRDFAQYLDRYIHSPSHKDVGL